MKVQTRFSDKFLNKTEQEAFLAKRKRFKLKQKDIAQPCGLDISSVRLADSKEQYPRYYMLLIENLELKEKIEQQESKIEENNNFLNQLIKDINSFKNSD